MQKEYYDTLRQKGYSYQQALDVVYGKVDSQTGQKQGETLDEKRERARILASAGLDKGQNIAKVIETTPYKVNYNSKAEMDNRNSNVLARQNLRKEGYSEEKIKEIVIGKADERGILQSGTPHEMLKRYNTLVQKGGLSSDQAKELVYGDQTNLTEEQKKEAIAYAQRAGNDKEIIEKSWWSRNQGWIWGGLGVIAAGFGVAALLGAFKKSDKSSSSDSSSSVLSDVVSSLTGNQQSADSNTQSGNGLLDTLGNNSSHITGGTQLKDMTPVNLAGGKGIE